MADFTGDQEWRVEDVPPNADNPLPGIWIRAWRGDAPVASGPSWRYATPEQAAAARAEAQAILAWRNGNEALTAVVPEAAGRRFAELVDAVVARRSVARAHGDAAEAARLAGLLGAVGITVQDTDSGTTWRREGA